MKIYIYKSIIISFILFSIPAKGASLGLGVILGEPTGISGNYILSKSKSIDGALAFDLGNDSIHLHGTYLWRFPKSLKLDSIKLGWFTGVGAKIRTFDEDKKDDFGIGPRASIGANYELSKVPLEIFGEIALSLSILPRTDADLDLGIGLRYYF